MYSQTLLPRIREFELAMGHTHRCLNCRSTFLAHEDGCPNCGPGAFTVLLNGPRRCSEKIKDEDVWYWVFYDKTTSKVEYVFPGDLCPWPKEEGRK